MSMNRAHPVRNTMPWSVASAALGLLTVGFAAATVAVWTSSHGSGPIGALVVLVIALGASAVFTGAPGRRNGRGEPTGGGLALAGILMGAIGIVATIAYIVLSVVFVLAVYLVVGLMFAASGVDLAGAVLGSGL